MWTASGVRETAGKSGCLHPRDFSPGIMKEKASCSDFSLDGGGGGGKPNRLSALSLQVA